jgi:hypothetical protein
MKMTQKRYSNNFFYDVDKLDAILAFLSDMQQYESDNGVLFNKDKTELIAFPNGRKGDYVIPNSVVEIGIQAFNACSGLSSVTFPDSIKAIGYWAFAGCSGFTSVVIPDSVTVIKKFTFENCSGLTSVFIPDSVTSIEKCTFSGCTALTDITVHPDNPVYRSENGKLLLKE